MNDNIDLVFSTYQMNDEVLLRINLELVYIFKLIVFYSHWLSTSINVLTLACLSSFCVYFRGIMKLIQLRFNFEQGYMFESIVFYL